MGDDDVVPRRGEEGKVRDDDLTRRVDDDVVPRQGGRGRRASERPRGREGIRINYDVRAPLCETAFRGSVNGASESARERSSACLITE